MVSLFSSHLHTYHSQISHAHVTHTHPQTIMASTHHNSSYHSAQTHPQSSHSSPSSSSSSSAYHSQISHAHVTVELGSPPPPHLQMQMQQDMMMVPFARLVEFQAFSRQELVAATNDFQNALGEGAFGEVFEGCLASGKQIAVKRLRPMAVQEEKEEFQREIRSIATVNHKNILQLLGFCLDGDPLLVCPKLYSLQKALDDDNGRHILSWNDRYNIALGVAKGLAYLHSGARIPMIHCDIKPGNILLDPTTLEPCIADFGLVHLLGQGGDQILNAATLYGTPGYMAPELRLDRRFSLKSDVYSFGKLLYAIVSGEENVNNLPSSLVSKKRLFASLILNERRAMQPCRYFCMPLTVLCLWPWRPPTTVSLFSNFLFFWGVQLKDVDERVRASVRGSTRAIVQAYKALDLIALCIQDDPSLRPNMDRVVLALESANVCDIPWGLRTVTKLDVCLRWVVLCIFIVLLLAAEIGLVGSYAVFGGFSVLLAGFFVVTFILYAVIQDNARLFSYPKRMISFSAIPI